MKKKIYFISFFMCFIDQIIKFLTEKFLIINDSYPVVSNFFYITLAHNEGASWSLFSGQRLLLIVLSLLFLFVINKYISDFKENKRNVIAFSLILGGLFGNLVDRIFRGYVIDYLDFYIFNYDFPIFNLADMCIVSGVFLLIISILKGDDENGISSRSRKY